jgi:hypothetical protein
MLSLSAQRQATPKKMSADSLRVQLDKAGLDVEQVCTVHRAALLEAMANLELEAGGPEQMGAKLQKDMWEKGIHFTRARVGSDSRRIGEKKSGGIGRTEITQTASV